MKRTLRFKSILLLLISCLLISGSVLAQDYENGMLKGVVRVKFKPQLTSTLSSAKASRAGGFVLTGIQAVDNVNKQFTASEMKRVFPYSPQFEEKHKKYGLHQWYEIRYTTGTSVSEAIAGYSVLDEVISAEPVLEKQLITGDVQPAAAAPASEGVPFNDPRLLEQWHYNNTGELEHSLPGADINLYKAWEIQKGSPNVTVCIVDGGIDVHHEDLAANVWVNQAELNGEEGVDDDGNGYVDDINGYNFTTRSGTITSHTHGTHVAGTVGAVNNNGIGVAGVAGGSGNNDGVKLMSTQVFSNKDGFGDFAAAIVYGADNGAVISQNSWGFTKPGAKEQVVLDAIDYFVAEAGQYEGSPMKGGIVFFAAGNANADGEWYPGYYESAQSVASIGPDFMRASYSNYGEWVDFALPGGEQKHGDDHAILSTLDGNRYGFMQGTSMACPHLSGIAALVVSEFGGSDFTNTDLKNRLQTSVHDIDQYNPGYEGKLGAGYVDTWLALQKDNGIAPDPIVDLNLEGIAQEFATMTWTTPADEDDIQPSGFEILYHTEAITEDNALDAEKISVNCIDTVGTAKRFDVQELLPLTTYYFAVRSIDRWGNASRVSNVVSGTTNAGPAIKADKEEINLTVDAALSTSTSDDLTLLNEAEGVLKWNAEVRHKNFSLAYNAAGLNYPESKVLPASYQSRIERLRCEEEMVSPQATAEPMSSNYEEIGYGNDFASMHIGDLDTTITNSSATRFVVNNPEGFNLTGIDMSLKHNPSTGPMIMEIYLGEQIDKKNLLIAQEVTSYNPSPYWRYIDLDEQFMLEAGTVFWVVFHVPSGNEFPLGITWEMDSKYSDNCLMSFDLGKNWVPLAEALEDDRYVWTTFAVSKNKHLGNYISLEPASGIVEGYQNQEIQLEVDASTLINGDYQSNLVIQSNDGDDKFFRIPLNVSVSGHLPVLVHDEVVDFGSVFFGHEKELVIPIQNSGYGNFRIKSAISTDPQFKIVKKSRSINARDNGTITILYTPDGAGNDNGKIELTDRLGHKHTISLFGVGAAPSEIEVSPAEQHLGEMSVGDKLTTQLTISNKGEYPLKYMIPAFAEEGVEIEGVENIHKYGYTLESNVNGDTTALYSWEDIASTGTNVTSHFQQYDTRYLEVDLGFEFPFYGEKITKFNITNNGALTLDQEGPLFSNRPPQLDKGSPKGFICATGHQLDLLKAGKILYKREPGKLIVQYQDVEDLVAYNEGQTYTFQIVLFYNGDIELRYKDVEKMDRYNRKYALIGVNDPSYEDGVLINGNKDSGNRISGQLSHNETVFRIKSPGQNLVSSVSEPSGMIAVGESKTIDVEVDTEEMYEGKFFQRLAVVSNDPFNKAVAFTIKSDVTAGGVADVSLNKSDVDMGQVFQGGSRREMVQVINDGTKDISISSISLESNKFTLIGEAPVLLKAKSSYFILVELITIEKGAVEDVLLVETEDGNTYKVNLLGEVIPAPGITVDVTSMNETLDAGSKVMKTITLTNSGEADLEIVPAGNDWLYLSEAETMNVNLPKFSYSVLDSDDEDGPVFNWEDIRETGTHITWDYFFSENGENFWYPLALTTEFPFYNEQQDTLWIGWSGVMTFNKPESPEFPWPSPLPNAAEPNNLIAPYFAVQKWNAGNPNQDEVGIFYQVFDDRVVIQSSEMVDPFGMTPPYSYEVILYNNGIIKFQYEKEFLSKTNMGCIGLENADGTDGVQVAAFQDYIKDELAVSFTPSEKQIIPAGESRVFNLALDAKYLTKGSYTGNFRVLNNTPQNPELLVPVTLTVNGEAAIQTPDAIAFGQVMAYQVEGERGPEPKSYEQVFKVRNTGTDILDFSRIYLADGTEVVAEMEYIHPIFGSKSWREIPPFFYPNAPFVIVPGKAAIFKIRLQPSGEHAVVNDSLVFETNNLPSGVYKLPIEASVILPPELAVSEESVSVFANTQEHQEVRTVTLDNTKGQSALDYNLGINFFRAGEEQEAQNTKANLFSLESEHKLLVSPSVESNWIQTYSEDSYNMVLEYDTLTTPTNALGYGPNMAMSVATAFHAPDNGFNLTHVKTWYDAGELLNSKIRVEVRAGGSSIFDTKVLTTQEFEVNLDAPVKGGQYENFELAENQIFYPGETFYLVIYYQLGVAYPQGVSQLEEDLKGTFFYSSGDGWYDLSENGFTNHGWMVKAMEKEHKTKAWVSIDGELEGSVPVGESLTVTLNFKASDAQDVDNDAELVIATNDPKNSENTVDLHLHINQGPQFDVESELKVNENESLNFVVTAQDVEGDVCSYALAEANDFVQMTEQNDTLSFVYTPDFESAGLNSITIKGEDVHGNVTNLEIPIEVVNVNRAPEVINTIATREYYEDGEYDEINLTSVFEDPDGEALTYSVSSDNESFINIFVADEDVIIKSQSEGNGFVTLVATDTEGLSVETNFEVIVGTVTGIEDVEGTSETKVYPVPTSGPLNIVLGNDIEGEVKISILNVTGLTQYQTTVNKMSGEHIERLNISNMPSGIYLVKITSAKGDIVKRVVKI